MIATLLGSLGSGQNDSLTMWHVETFAEKFGVAKNFNLTNSEVINDRITNSGGSFSVAMSGTDTGVAKSLGNVNGVSDVYAIADSRFIFS